MALVKCPECDAQISDKAATCPRCGAPLAVPSIAPQPTYVQYVVPGQPFMGQPQPMQQVVYTTVPVAASAVVLPAEQPVVEVEERKPRAPQHTREFFFPCGSDKRAFHEKCMRQLMRRAQVDIFEKIEDMKVSQKFVWVREFSRDGEREYYPMSEYGERFFNDLNGSPILRGNTFDSYYPSLQLMPYHSSLIAGKEVIAREFSAAETDERYMDNIESLGFDATENYYLLPVYEESYNYCGGSYIFRGVGNEEISKYCWNDMPYSELLRQGPQYTTIAPLRSAGAAIGVVLALVITIALFATVGFWLALVIIFITGGICFYMGSQLVTPFMDMLNHLDKKIQRHINNRRRDEYLRECEAIQCRKQADARKYLGLELTYNLPDCPIP